MTTLFRLAGRLTAAFLLTLPLAARAQTPGVGIGTTAPDVSAALDIVSSSKGALLPRVADATALATPATGLLVFQTGAPAGFYYNAGTPAAPSWQQLATASGAAVTASNGLSKVGQDVRLGGTLTQATDINLNGNNLTTSGSGNLGVGVANPGYKLQVGGNFRSALTNGTFSTNNFGPAGGTVLLGTFDGAGGNGAQLRFSGALAAGTFVDVGQDAGGNFVVQTNDVPRLTVLGRDNGATEGNVGIGTSTPTQRLDVTGNTNVTGNTTVTGNSYLSSPGGRLGLGTTIPIGRLHAVNDGGGAAAADDYILDEYGLGDQGLIMRRAGGTVAAPANLANGDQLGQISFVPRYNNTNLSFFGSHLRGHYTGDGTTFSTDLRLLTSNTERMRIDGTGNVGIGTTTPNATALLDVSSTNKGFLPPRLNTGQRNAIVSPAIGLTIYNTSTNVLNVWDGAQWSALLTNNTNLNPVTFNYTGAPRTYTVPAGITQLLIDMAGAAGGPVLSTTTGQGRGGRVQATLAVTAGQILNLYVGQAGAAGTGGYNGGGPVAPGTAGGGGGASDIRRGGTALTDRLLVAGGGGGGGDLTAGGAGGGLSGVAGTDAGGPGTGGQGGTATAGGTGGVAGGQPAGGDGSLGQGGSGNGFSGGGGGSSYAGPGTSAVTHTQGFQAGNGYIIISPVTTGLPPVTITNLNYRELWTKSGTALQTTDVTTSSLRIGGDTSPATFPAVGGGVEMTSPNTNTDLLGLYRANVASNQSELRMVVGDDPTQATNAPSTGDRFVLGTSGSSGAGGLLSGTFTPRFNILSNGSVGIGTVPTTSRLDVVATNNTAANAIATLSTLDLTQGVSLSAQGLTSAGSNANNDLALDSKGTGNILLHAAGNTGKVGIGNNNPFSLLANTTSNVIGSNSQGGNPNSLTWAASQTGFIGLLYNGQVGSGHGLAVKVAASDVGTAVLDVSAGTAQTTAGTSLFKVHANGFVGIGVSGNPAATLHVGGTAGTANVRLASLGGTGTRVVTADASGNLGSSTATAAFGSSFIQNGTTQQASADFNIDGTGTVGGSLVAGSNVVVDAADANAGTFSSVLQFGGGSGEGIGSQRTGGANQFGLDFYTGFTNRLSISNGGNVGIGTSSPNAPLQLANGLANRKLVLYESVNNDHEFLGFGINAGMLRYKVANASDNHVFFRGNGAAASVELMRIAGSGNVGIGTSNPTARLTVQPATDADLGLRVTNGVADGTSTSGNIVLQTLTGGNSGFSTINFNGAYNGGEVRFNTTKNRWRMGVDQRGIDEFFLETWNGTTSSTLLRGTSAGNVGIGVSPTAKLHVAGNVKIDAANTLEFGAGVVGKEVNAGKIGYRTFSADALDIVGAGTGSNRIIRFYAEGGAVFNGPVFGVGAFNSSDQRLKQNIRPLGGALASVLALRGVRYEWNTLGVQHGGKAGAGQVGLIAQEIEQVYPELVNTDAQGFKSVNYAQLTPVLIEAIKEQQQQIEALKARAATAEAQAATSATELQKVKAQAGATTDAFEARLRALEAGGGLHPAGQARK